MGYHYSNPADRYEHSLPDVETWQDEIRECAECGALFPRLEALDVCRGALGGCGRYDVEWRTPRAGEWPERAWFWEWSTPGYLPTGDPKGPFKTEAEALADVRLAAGVE